MNKQSIPTPENIVNPLYPPGIRVIYRPTICIEPQRCPHCHSASIRRKPQTDSREWKQCQTCGHVGVGDSFLVNPPFVVQDNKDGMLTVACKDTVPHAVRRLFLNMWLQAIGHGTEPYLEAFQDDLLYHDARHLVRDHDLGAFVWVLGRSHTGFYERGSFKVGEGFYGMIHEGDRLFVGNTLNGELNEVSIQYAEAILRDRI
jgi:hypothetical protein